MSETIYDQLVHSNAVSCGLGRWKAPPGRLSACFSQYRSLYLSYNFILNRRGTCAVSCHD